MQAIEAMKLLKKHKMKSSLSSRQLELIHQLERTVLTDEQLNNVEGYLFGTSVNKGQPYSIVFSLGNSVVEGIPFESMISSITCSAPEVTLLSTTSLVPDTIRPLGWEP